MDLYRHNQHIYSKERAIFPTSSFLRCIKTQNEPYKSWIIALSSEDTPCYVQSFCEELKALGAL